MQNKLLDKDFDMELFIEKRLVEIESLEDRKEVREMMSQVFKELFQYTRGQYEQLEEKIAGEMKRGTESFTIYTGVAEQKYYDITGDSMFPMIAEDLEENVIETKMLLDSLQKGVPVKAFNVFLEMDYSEICLLMEKKQQFHGYIYTENAEYPVTAELRPDTRYQKVVKKLFQIVVNNGLPWRTICAPYLNKFFEVYLVKTELPFYEKIETIKVDFGEYEEKMRYHCFPVWNLEETTGVADVKSVGSLDRVQYQHMITKRRMNEDFYLVADTEEMLTKDVCEDGIIITTFISDAREWKLYRVVPKVTQLFEYPIFSNEREGQQMEAVRTKGGIMHLVNSLGYEDRIELISVDFPEKYNEAPITYGMDSEMVDECYAGKNRPPMVLSFAKKADDFVQTDILSYVVSAVQRKYPEFMCYGEYRME